MNELIVIVSVMVVVLMGCFVVVRAMERKPRNGTSAYWEINPNQQSAKRAYTGYGKPRPEGSYKIPLRVTEAPDEFDNTPKRRQTTRYFEKD